MNITDFLNIMELTPEEDRALLYSTSATLALCCMHRGFFLTKKICVCGYKHFKKRSSTYASKNKEEVIYLGESSDHVIEYSEKEKNTKVNSIV